MIKRILTFIKAPWICGIVSKIALGLSVSIVVFNYIRKEFEGSEFGDKIIPIITDVQEFAESALGSVEKISGFVCGKNVVLTSTLTIDQARETLKITSEELKNI